MRRAIVVLPSPVGPTSATRSPGASVNEQSRSTHCSSSYANQTLLNSTAGLGALPPGLLFLYPLGSPAAAPRQTGRLASGCASPCNCRPGYRSGGGRGDGGVGVEQGEDALGRDHGGLHDRVLGAQVPDGEEEAAGVLEEGHQAAEGERPGHHLPAPVPEQQGHRGGAQGLHRRVEGGVVERRAELAGAQRAGELPERLPLPGLAREELDHAHALERLLQEGVHPGQPGADHPVAVPRAHAEVRRGQHQQGHQRERDEGQLPVHPEHDHDDAGEDDHVAQERHDPAGEQLLDRLPVVQDPGHQPPDRAPVVEARVLALEMREQRRAQIVDDALAGELGEVGLRRPQRVEGDEDQQEQRRDARRAPPSRGGGCGRRSRS